MKKTDSDEPRVSPTAAATRTVKFFHLGDDHVWCPDCKAWVGTDGDTSITCEHPSLQVEMDDAPPTTCEEAQRAIDALYALFRETDDLAAVSAKALHDIRFIVSRILAGPKLPKAIRVSLEGIVSTAIAASTPETSHA